MGEHLAVIALGVVAGGLIAPDGGAKPASTLKLTTTQQLLADRIETRRRDARLARISILEFRRVLRV